MAERFVLALDCGSTNLKAGLFSGGLRPLGEASQPVTYTYHGPDRYEFAAEDSWERAVQVIGDVCKEAGIGVQQLTDIALGSQAQSFLFVDSQGKALTSVISWLDRTAEQESVLARAAFGSEFHQHCSFSDPIPQLQVCKVRQAVTKNASLAAGQLVSLPGFLALRLGVPNAIDENLAAMGGLYSLAEHRWWPVAMAYAGIQSEQLPAVVSLAEGLSTVKPCAPLGLMPGLRIVFAGNDQTCGAYGNGVSEGTVLATLGTALVAYRCTGDVPGPYAKNTFWGPYPGDRYYELATRDEGCLALDWVREQLCPDLAARAFDEAALSQRPSVDLDSPLFWPGQIGGDDGLPQTCEFGEAAYATLEGIGFTLRELLEDDLQIEHGKNTIKLAGGGGKSPVWRQIIADILNCPTVDAGGNSLLGAAAMALGVAVSSGTGSGRCEPDGDTAELLEQRFRRWQKHGH